MCVHSVTPWDRVALEKLIFDQEVKNYPPFVEIEVHYRVYKNPPLQPIWSQINQFHIRAHCFFNFNVIVPLTIKSSYWFLSFRFCNKKFVSISQLSCACCLTHVLFWI